MVPGGKVVGARGFSLLRQRGAPLHFMLPLLTTLPLQIPANDFFLRCLHGVTL